MAKDELLEIAWRIAVAAPPVQNGTAFAAKIPWTMIDELRAELVNRGYDVDGGVQRRLEREREWQAEQNQKRAGRERARQAWQAEHVDDVCGGCGHSRRFHGSGAWYCSWRDAKGCPCSAFVGEQYEPAAVTS